MSVNQGLEFVYQSGKDDKGSTLFNWRITGNSKGATLEETVITANKLWQNLNVVLGTFKNDYYFAPITEAGKLEDDKSENGWLGLIKPVGIAINANSHVPIGFTKENNSMQRASSVIIVPNGINRKALDFNSLSIAVAGGMDIKLVFSITPVVLAENDLQKIASALKWLCNGEKKLIRYHQGIKEGTEDDEILKNLKYSLDLWLKNPSGFRLTCKAFSKEPIPSSFLSVIGNEIFDCPISIKIKKIDDEKVMRDGDNDENFTSNILDLQNCINGASIMPPLFPGVETLIGCGVNRLFSQSAIEVASDGTLLGYSGVGATTREVYFSRPDRSRHCYIIGATGTGKSTLLYNMILQDINSGEGVTLIDPHGELYQDVLKSIPKNRINDVILIDPCDFDYAVGINFLECNGLYKPVQMNFIVNEMIKIFDRLYDLKATGGPIFEQYMRNALFLIMDNELNDATLTDLTMVFEDKQYRQFLKTKCKSPFVESFWTNQAEEAGGEAALKNIAPYITSKLNQFTHNALLRPIIGQSKSTIDFRQAMDSGKIILVNLSKGLLGELDSQLLGMLIIGKIFSSAMGRVMQRPEDRRPMYLYIDEFQNFTTDSVAHLLSEARKFGIFLTLANQNMTQLKSNSGKNNILDSVLGNVGSMLILRLGAIDSEKMETYTKPELLAQDLQDLPDFTVAARLLNKNAPIRPFVFKTVPMMQPDDSATVMEIIQNSRRNYATPTEKVEQDIVKRISMYEKSS